MTTIRVKRGTRAQLDAAATASGLLEGEPYFINDEETFAIGTSTSTYKTVSGTQGEPGSVTGITTYPDVSSSDSAALQTAALLEAVEDSITDGTILVLPNWTIELTSQVLLDGPITIVGSGANSVLKHTSGVTGFIPLLIQNSVTPIENIRLINFSIDGNELGQDGAGLLQIYDAVNFLVSGLHVYDGGVADSTKVSGIACDIGTTTSSGTITGCLVEGCTRSGIHWGNGASDGLILGNTCRNNSGDSGATPGIHVMGGYNGKVAFNKTYANQGPGIMASTSEELTPDYASRRLVITGNHSYGNGNQVDSVQGSAIYLTNSALNTELTGNTIITNNHCYENTIDSGVKIENMRGVLLQGNHVYKNGLAGLALDGGQYIKILDNDFADNNMKNQANWPGIFIFPTNSGVSMHHIEIKGNTIRNTDGGYQRSPISVYDSANTGAEYVTIEGNASYGHVDRDYIQWDYRLPKHSKIQYEVSLQTTSATLAIVWKGQLGDDQCASINLRAIGEEDGGSGYALFDSTGLLYRNTGSNAGVASSVYQPIAIKMSNAWTVGMYPSGWDIVGKVTGAISTTVNWHVTMEIVTP